MANGNLLRVSLKRDASGCQISHLKTFCYSNSRFGFWFFEEEATRQRRKWFTEPRPAFWQPLLWPGQPCPLTPPPRHHPRVQTTRRRLSKATQAIAASKIRETATTAAEEATQCGQHRPSRMEGGATGAVGILTPWNKCIFGNKTLMWNVIIETISCKVM